MRINEKGLELVKEFEGLYLEAYRDPVGIWTIGWGHTGPAAFEGNRITRNQAISLLEQDMAEFEQAVLDTVQVPINSNQFAALVSFSFNVGAGALRRSTLLRLLNQRNYAGAVEQFARWNKATISGKKTVLRGLSRRRAAEANLFQTPITPRGDLSESRTMKAGRAGIAVCGTGLALDAATAVETGLPLLEQIINKLSPMLLLVVITLLIAVLFFRADDHRRGLR